MNKIRIEIGDEIREERVSRNESSLIVIAVNTNNGDIRYIVAAYKFNKENIYSIPDVRIIHKIDVNKETPLCIDIDSDIDNVLAGDCIIAISKNINKCNTIEAYSSGGIVSIRADEIRKGVVHSYPKIGMLKKNVYAAEFCSSNGNGISYDKRIDILVSGKVAMCRVCNWTKKLILLSINANIDNIIESRAVYAQGDIGELNAKLLVTSNEYIVG